MALQLTTVSAISGVEGNYWRISRTQYDRHTNKTAVELGLWADAGKAAANYGSLGDKQHFMMDGEHDRADAYNHIKALPGWEEAEDC